MTTEQNQDGQPGAGASLRKGAVAAPTGPSAGAGSPAGPAVNEGLAASDFARDVGSASLREALTDYVQRVRGGEVGALPALLGLVVMVVIFTQASSVFLSVGNVANLPAQAATTILIGMGLVFVLLLGEIDLSAGTASGVCAGGMALALTHHGDVRAALGTGTWGLYVLLLVAAIAVAAWSRIWPVVAIVALGVAIMLTHLASSAIIAILLAVATGVAIGTLTGFLVARVGIPSFVVTLALFLAWQGVLLKFEGEGNAVPTRQFNVINNLANSNLKPVYGWVLFLVLIGAYLGYTLFRSIRRRADGLAAEPVALVLFRGVSLFIVGGAAVYLLNKERGPNPALASIKGMPYVVPVVLFLMIFWTFVLGKTAFGRYVYATGGNPEAARRAGIDLTRIRISCFAIGSGMAALGGVVAASKLGGVPSDAGGGNQLLYAVGAAVIGGTSLFGGRGRPRDAILGGLVIMMIPNGLGLAQLSSAYNFVVTGLVLLIAASVDALSRRRAAAAGR
jgi:D-xylose transport system permease protein